MCYAIHVNDQTSDRGGFMKYQQVLLNTDLRANEEKIIDFGKYYPLGKVKHNHLIKKEIYHVNAWKSVDTPDDFNNITARYIKLLATKNDNVTITIGQGYIATKDPIWERPFNRTNGWAGADGIFSFNIEDGNDGYNQRHKTSLFVFGDTLIGKVNEKTKKRTDPLLMPSNTVAYLNGDQRQPEAIEFDINLDEKQRVIPFLEPENPAVYEGYHAHNLLTGKGAYLSGYGPETITLEFDLRRETFVSHMDVYNYYQEESADDAVMNRGIKHMKVYVSSDGFDWALHQEASLRKAKAVTDKETLTFNQTLRHIRFVIEGEVGKGNHYTEKDTHESLFGLTRVELFNGSHRLHDFEASCNSCLKRTKMDTWFWLQDGVVMDRHIYFLPLIITSDPDRPEGLQFSVEGVCMVKAPIENKRVNFNKHVQKPTVLYRNQDDEERLFGAAIMNYTRDAGYESGDGFIYIYGYSTKNQLRRLHVARVRPSDFENIDAWQFYNQGHWGYSMNEASPILENVSCEMSVSPIVSGLNKGKFLAVFQYNVDSDFVAYSIGDTPAGPFSDPHIVYECEEPKTFKRKTYAYNAKAHPHLSTPDEILVTYNVNTYDMNHHYDNAEVYHPRFIRLKDTTVE